jgi:hypothetical protein
LALLHFPCEIKFVVDSCGSSIFSTLPITTSD